MIKPPIKSNNTIIPIRFSEKLPSILEYLPLCFKFENNPPKNINNIIGTPIIIDIKTNPSTRDLQPVNPKTSGRTISNILLRLTSKLLVWLWDITKLTKFIINLKKSNPINFAQIG